MAEFTIRFLQHHEIIGDESLVFRTVDYGSPSIPSQNPRLAWEFLTESPLINSDGFRDRDFCLSDTRVLRFVRGQVQLGLAAG